MLRVAAKASGVERLTSIWRCSAAPRWAAEAAQALVRPGMRSRKWHRAPRSERQLRRREDLLGDVADAFARIEDPAERVPLAFKLFGSEGVALSTC